MYLLDDRLQFAERVVAEQVRPTVTVRRTEVGDRFHCRRCRCFRRERRESSVDPVRDPTLRVDTAGRDDRREFGRRVARQVVDVPVAGVVVAGRDSAVAVDTREPAGAECAPDVGVGTGRQVVRSECAGRDLAGCIADEEEGVGPAVAGRLRDSVVACHGRQSVALGEKPGALRQGGSRRVGGGDGVEPADPRCQNAFVAGGRLSSVSDPDTLRRLSALSDETFGRFVAEVAETVASDAAVTVAPPSPAGGVDAVIESESDDRRLLFHVRRPVDPTPPRVADETDAPGRSGEETDESGGEETVPEFDEVELREILTVGESFDAVVVAVAGPVTAEARAFAEESGVRLLDGSDLSSLIRKRGVEIPRPESVAERLDRLVERQASEWPQAVSDLASEVLAEIEGLADFDHRVVHADETTDVDFLFARGADPDRQGGTDPVVRARLTETEFRVYVADADDQFECVTALSVIRDREPTLEAILAEVLPPVRSAVERRG